MKTKRRQQFKIKFPVYVLFKDDLVIYNKFKKDGVNIISVFTKKFFANERRDEIAAANRSSDCEFKVVEFPNLDEFRAFFKLTKIKIDYFIIDWRGESGNFPLIRTEDILEPSPDEDVQGRVEVYPPRKQIEQEVSNV